MFQHTAARRRLAVKVDVKSDIELLFQHTAARRRLVQWNVLRIVGAKFQHTAARRRLGLAAE